MKAGTTWTLPGWVGDASTAWPDPIHGDEARMRLVVELASRNVREGTGGPFGAAVFDMTSGRLLAVGVNRVVPNGCSHAHAEMMAIARAQGALGTHDLAAQGGRHELVSSCEPCAMCFGAIPWSGVVRLVCGATDADARAVGFDEGPRPDDWIEELRSRGIETVIRVCRDAAREVLHRYLASGGEIYNSHRDT